MKKKPSDDASSFCESVLSSLPGSFDVFACYFVDGNPTESVDVFDYQIMVVSPSFVDITIPLYRISDANELSFLECLLLQQVIEVVDSMESFVLGARFGPKVNRESDGTALSDLDIQYLGGMDLMNEVIKCLGLTSPNYLLFDDITPIYGLSPVWLPLVTEPLVEKLYAEKPLDDETIEDLGIMLDWGVSDVGLAKLLTIPELGLKERMQELPLTKEDASRIYLMQDIVQPPYNIRPTIDPRSIETHWAQLPARLFLYGPILDLANALREKRIIKVCWNCGELYRPYQSEYHKKKQHYCSPECRKRAERKRRYQREKQAER